MDKVRRGCARCQASADGARAGQKTCNLKPEPEKPKTQISLEILGSNLQNPDLFWVIRVS